MVLLSCGSFNPPTIMHLRMFELAADALRKVSPDAVFLAHSSPACRHHPRPLGLSDQVHRDASRTQHEPCRPAFGAACSCPDILGRLRRQYSGSQVMRTARHVEP